MRDQLKPAGVCGHLPRFLPLRGPDLLRVHPSRPS
jgi:hypothetical protein